MKDEMFDRDYQSGRDDLNDGIDRGIAGFIAGLRTAFEALHRVQWSAPWTTRPDAQCAKRSGLA